MQVQVDFEQMRQELDDEFRIAEYKQRLEMLEWVRLKAASRSTPSSAKPASKLAQKIANATGIQRLIISILPELPPQFDKDGILAKLREKYPNRGEIKANSLRSILFVLVREKYLESVQRGGGNKLTLYRRGPKSLG